MRPRPTRGTLPVTAALRALALLLAAALLPACAQQVASGPFPQLSRYEGREVEDVEFVGELLIPKDSINAVVTTRPSRCRLLVLPICIGSLGEDNYELDLQVLSRDVVRIGLLYRDQGYYGTRVVPSVEEAPEGRVNVRFAILPGDRVTLRSLTVTGTDTIVPEAELLEQVPLKVGEPFRRIDFIASVDTVRNELLERGRAYAQVFRNYQIDTIADVADVQLEAAPGPRVTVDSIIFTGNYRLTPRTARQQLSFREGSLLRGTELARSQRNLFELELVRYASVEVAPESLQVTPDSAELGADSIGSTVLVRIIEAPKYAVDVAGGYGTVDCLRAQGSHVDRNFLGGARRLEVSGLVSKVGVGSPLDFGLEKTIACEAFDLSRAPTEVDTLIANALNYRVAVDFNQPRLFGTRTSFGAGAYAERISELGLYLRRSTGGRLGIARQVARGTVASVSYTIERGNTQADDEFFCIVFEVCTPEDIAPLRENRWSNSLSLGILRNRVRQNPFPTGGYFVRAGTDWASGLIGSDDEYLRLLGDGTLYREVRKDWVLSFRLLGGTFLSGLEDVSGAPIPPERRFYAGGPTTVRGYTRNELGPTVYIRRIEADGEDRDTTIIRSPTGGTRMVVGTVEVTGPLPFGFGATALRGAAFVDAGGVWSGEENPLVPDPGIRFTPGIGVRAASPLGPIRFDLAYNPYAPERGPLYEIDENGNLVNGGLPVETDFRPENTGFLRRFRIHLSLGQTF